MEIRIGAPYWTKIALASAQQSQQAGTTMRMERSRTKPRHEA
jgi:hypothetical protein